MRLIQKSLFIGCIVVFLCSLKGYCRGAIICSEALTCSEFQRDTWRLKRAQVAILVKRKQNDTSKTYSSFLTTNFDALRFLPSLCVDHLSAGFLLNDASDHWPMTCLWSGNEKNATCAPGPANNAPISYIAPIKWRQLVRKLRMEIGCSSEQIEKANTIAELYVCKERCSHAGIGYIPSIFIMSTILLSWALLLMPP
uniref:Uncharacterized protein n=1 Tax=Parascaris univalens TaxID=6257 RepID=A0A915AI82_PARUN